MSGQIQSLEIPNVFRVLVIDDQICSNAICMDKVQSDSTHVQLLIRNYICSVVKKFAGGKKIHIEVDFAKDPDEGVGRWMESVYDITLIDSDFSRDDMMKTKIDDLQKRNFLDLRLDFAGAYLYCFLREMLSGEKFGVGRKGCSVALWTGLGLGDDNKNKRAQRLISILPHGEDKDRLCFIPKKEGDRGRWQRLGLDNDEIMTIEQLIGKMAKKL